MAIPDVMKWVCRADGADTNGAGFYPAGGSGTDYTNQAAAQATFTNLTTAGAGATTLTDGDAGALFTVQMENNVIYIASGTNFSAGYYRIVTFTDADNVILDRSPTPGAAGANGAGKVGGARLTITDAFLEALTDGSTFHIKNGTYTPGAINLANDGTSLLPITIEGFDSTPGDAPTDNDRPLINSAANLLLLANYWHTKHLRTQTTSAYGLYFDTHGYAENCKCDGSGSASGNYALYFNGNGLAVSCEAFANRSSGNAIRAGDSRFLFCYMHDSAWGFEPLAGAAGANNVFLFCTIENNSSGGLYLAAGIDCAAYHCTIDGNGIGILGTTGLNFTGMNNQITHNTTGAQWTNNYLSNFWDDNNWHGNGTDVTNVTKGPNATADDPNYANAAGGDFSDVDDANARVMTLAVG